MKRRIGEAITSLVAAYAVLWLYAWTLTAVGGQIPASRVPAPNDYYNHLVAGFVHGHLYMDLPVSDALKALPDPYDPRQNEPYRLTDASYYHGRYYLYFGAAPAVTVLLPYRLATGEYLATPKAILIFASIGFLAMAAVYLAVRRRYFPAAPWWTGPVGVLLLGIGSMADVLIRRPFFWELATAGGFAFAMLAIAALYAAIHCERRRVGWLTASGILLGLAVASRPTYIYAIPVLAVPLMAWAQIEGVTRRWWHMVLGAAFGIGAIGVAVFAYNSARFGSGFEFGHNYLLSVAYESKVRLFSPAYFWFNARMYFLLPGHWSWHPPFFAPVPIPRSAMPPGFYTVDDPFGLLPIFPLAVLAIAAPFALIGRSGPQRIQLRATLLAIALLTISAGLVILLYVATIPRYAVDFLPALILLAVLGLLGMVCADARRWIRLVARSAVAALAIISIGTGTITIFNLGQLLSFMHPDRLGPITRVTSHLEWLIDRSRHVHYGPIELSIRFDGDITAEPRPLLTAGAPERPDRVLIQRISDRQIRVGIQHADASPQWSNGIAADGAAEHRLWVELGSFYPGLDHALFAQAGYAKASWLEHRAEIKVDGQTVLRTFAPFEPSRRGAPHVGNIGTPGPPVTFRLLEPQIAERAIDAPRNRQFDFVAPADETPHQLPLISSGTGTNSDVLFLETASGARARLGYIHGTAAPIWSDEFPLVRDAVHHLQLREDENGWAQPQRDERSLVAWMDGMLVWNRFAPASHTLPDTVMVGRTSAGSATVAREFPGLASASENSTQQMGGPLLVRMMLPHGVKGAWLPVLCTGQPGAGDTLSVNYMSQDAVQFRFDHNGGPLLVGTTAVVDERIGHDLEMYLPSFAANEFGKAADGEMWVKLDGKEVLRGRTSTYGFAPAELSLGRNTNGAGLIDAEFPGAFIKTDWLGR